MIVYTDNVQNAIVIATALGVMKKQSRLLRYEELTTSVVADLAKAYEELAYFQTEFNGETVLFTWGNEYFVLAEPKATDEIKVELKFKLARKMKTLEAIMNSILSNKGETVIVNACVGENATYNFLKVYKYCKIAEKGKEIKRANLTTLGKEEIKEAFANLKQVETIENDLTIEDTRRAIYRASNNAIDFCLQNIISGYASLPFRFAPFIQYIDTAAAPPKKEEIAENYGCKDYGMNIPMANYGIDLLVNGEYIEVKGNGYVATEKGKKVLKILAPYTTLLNGELLSDWECKIATLALGEKNCKDAAEELKASVGDFLRKMCGELSAINVSTGILCPSCGKRELFSDGTRLYCFDCNWEIKKYLHCRPFTDQQLAYLIVKRETPLIGDFVDNEEFVRGRIYLDDGNTPHFTRDSKYTCPRCGRHLWIGSDRANYYCPAIGCGFNVKFQYLGHYMARREMSELLTNKLTPVIKNLKVENRNCSGRLYLDPNDKYKVKLLIQK